MSLLENERQAMLFRFNVAYVPKEAEAQLTDNPFTLRDAADDWKWMYDNNQAVARLESVLAEATESSDDEKDVLRLNLQKNKANAMFVKKMSFNKTRDRLILLLWAGDASLADPAFVDLSTRTRRIAQKGPTEGVGYGAHVMIDLNPSPRPIVYRAILECVPGLGRATITSYLNWLLRERAAIIKRTFDEPQPGGGSKALRWHPKLKSQLQGSLSLKEDLKAGEISGVELICRQPDELDEKDMTATRRSLRISTKGMSERRSADTRLAWLNKVKFWAKEHDYDEILVKIKPARGTRSFNARFQANASDAADITYARTVDLVGFSKILEQCPEEINEEIRVKMNGLLDQRGIWK